MKTIKIADGITATVSYDTELEFKNSFEWEVYGNTVHKISDEELNDPALYGHIRREMELTYWQTHYQTNYFDCGNYTTAMEYIRDNHMEIVDVNNDTHTITINDKMRKYPHYYEY